jgi:uncharacterized SAM-binding protein YcdF (DUF218 family)
MGWAIAGMHVAILAVLPAAGRSARRLSRRSPRPPATPPCPPPAPPSAGGGLAVVGLLFEYLALLRAAGPQRWAYDEMAAIGAMKFRFAEEQARPNPTLLCSRRAEPPGHRVVCMAGGVSLRPCACIDKRLEQACMHA